MSRVVAKMIETIESEMDVRHRAGNPEHLRMVEALLFAASEPLDQKALSTSLPEGADVPALLAALEAVYQKRGVNLCCVAGKYQFRTASDLAFLLRKETTRAKAPSKAAIETLAIIAYHQPVTRAEWKIFAVVANVQGHHRHAAGDRPGSRSAGSQAHTGPSRGPMATTEAFLVQFGLESVAHLPGLDELKAAGFLEAMPPSGFDVPNPTDALGG